MNITIYGDSILKGVLLENGRYIINRQWEEIFSKRFGSSVKNRSRFGCTIQKAMSLIRRDSAKRCEGTEYALLEFGGNDCDYCWAEVAAEPGRPHDCKTPPEQFVKEYREAISLVRDSGRTPVLVTLPPIHSERYLRFICRDGLSRENILSWLGDVEAIYRWQAMYSDMVEQVAKQEDVRLIDLRSAFLQDERGLEELLCADGIHPSRSGQGLIYETLMKSVA